MARNIIELYQYGKILDKIGLAEEGRVYMMFAYEMLNKE